MSDDTNQFDVVTFDGYRADERPSAVILEGRRLEVLEVESSWLESGIDPASDVHRVFMVRCRGGARFRLVLSESKGWEVEPLPGPEAVDS